MYNLNSIAVEINKEKLREVSDYIRQKKQDFLCLSCGPEHILPYGVKWKSLEHALYVTYTSLIDYNLRSVADDLWAASRKFFENYPDNVYPERIESEGPKNIIRIFKTLYANIYRAPASPEKMANRVYQASRYLLREANGDPRQLLGKYLEEGFERDSMRFLEWLKSQKYKGLPDGDKVIKLWFRTMCESEHIELGEGMWGFSRSELSRVPLPIDKNIISAGIALALVQVLKGRFEGSFSDVKEPFLEAWMSVAKSTSLIPLELDEPIWKIGRNCRRKRCAKDCFFESICPRKTDFMFKGEIQAPGPAWDILVWPIS